MCIRRRPLWMSVWDWRRIGRTAVPDLREPSSTIERFSKRIGVPVSAPVEILITTGDPEASYSVSRLVFPVKVMCPELLFEFPSSIAESLSPLPDTAIFRLWISRYWMYLTPLRHVQH